MVVEKTFRGKQASPRRRNPAAPRQMAWRRRSPGFGAIFDVPSRRPAATLARPRGGAGPYRQTERASRSLLSVGGDGEVHAEGGFSFTNSSVAAVVFGRPRRTESGPQEVSAIVVDEVVRGAPFRENTGEMPHSACLPRSCWCRHGVEDQANSASGRRFRRFAFFGAVVVIGEAA